MFDDFDKEKRNEAKAILLAAIFMAFLIGLMVAVTIAMWT